jgi:hypothetical protein
MDVRLFAEHREASMLDVVKELRRPHTRLFRQGVRFDHELADVNVFADPVLLRTQQMA